MKIVSYNVNGIRASIRKGLLEDMASLKAEVVCLQETKAQEDQVFAALGEDFPYHVFANSAVKKGYSGTCIISKQKPLAVHKDIGMEIHDQEGRVLTAEFDTFYLVNVYVPNAGEGLKRLDYRKTWDADFKNYLKHLETTKPLIVCGDFNVAHQPIDLARPQPNYNKSPGYTQIEIDGMSAFLEAGFIDTFRHLHPEKVAYSWWSYRANARTKNVGWRIDYFLVSERLADSVAEAAIHPEYMHSDHCPVSVEMS